MPERVTFRSQAGARFEAVLGEVLTETPATLLRAARVEQDDLPREIVVKLGRAPADVGRLDLERIACERLAHPHLSEYYGAARTEELGTVLAYERLAPNPLVLLNAPSARPTFRAPETHHYPLLPGVALELGFDTLQALEHVHAAGFVHGGVTLANLRVRLNGDRDPLERVSAGAYQGVLAGLGGAREVGFLESLRAGEVDPDLTPRLPPPLSAPEVLLERTELGGRQVLSQAMDAYAFGLLLYTLLTGRLPYDHLVQPAELAHADVLGELKLQETRGQASPVDLSALSALPLYDCPLVGRYEVSWPRFHAGVRHALRGCLDPDPAARWTPSRARAWFQDELDLAEREETRRRWTQGLFQWLPESNRLRGEAPGGGLWIHGAEDALVVETKEIEAAPGEDLPAHILALPPDADPNLTIAIRVDRPSERRLKRRLPAPVRLADLLRAVHGGAALPPGPYLLTNTRLAQQELARTRVHILGQAHSVALVSGEQVRHEVRLVVGRGASSDLLLERDQVSKEHAALGFDRASGRWYVEDLESSNGTAVGDRPLVPGQRQRLLQSGTTIRFGDAVSLTYMDAPGLKAFLLEVLELASQVKAAERAHATAQAQAEAKRRDQDLGITDDRPGGDEPAPEPEVLDVEAPALAEEAPDMGEAAPPPPAPDVEAPALADELPEAGPPAADAPRGDAAGDVSGLADELPESAPAPESVPLAIDDPVFAEEAPEEDAYAPTPLRSAPTRRIPRPRKSNVPAPTVFPLVRKGPTWKVLGPRATPYAEAGATFRITLRGQVEGTTASAEGLRAIVEAFGPDVESVEAKLDTFIVLYTRA